MTALRLALLALAGFGAVLRPYRLPAFAAPVLFSAVALATGATSWHRAGHDLRPLVDPLAFLLAAIPLAVLLDRLGYFEQLAELAEGRRRLVAGLWLLATATVAVLNLDAAVVLLTPLYIRVARKVHVPPRFLAFQPVILALLASSFLPVSNLTNLIAVARTGVGPVAFVEHLGLPGAVACVVGYWCYRASAKVVGGGDVESPAGPIRPQRAQPEVSRDKRAILVGSVVVAMVLVGFVLGPSVGIREWMVALGADAVLVVLVRSAPLGRVPWGTALVAAGLGVLAGAAVQGLPLASVFHGGGPLSTLRIAGATATGANLVNNLPALLVSLPFVKAHGSCSLWPTLLGVNLGPSLLVTGSLASLLWAESMRNLGEPVHAVQFLKVGLGVGLPATVAALAVLVAMAPIFGC